MELREVSRMKNIDVINSNQAAAIGVKLARPDVIAAYPITPQTPLVEYLAQLLPIKNLTPGCARWNQNTRP